MTALKNFTDPEFVTMNEMQLLRFVTLSRGLFPGQEFCPGSMIKCGEVVESGNPNAYAEEKQCAGRICRKIGNGISHVNVIRDDGTVWTIDLELFKSITPLVVIIE
jgi:hypothetical protein